MDVESGHASYGKTVPLMNIRHGQAVPYYARKTGDTRHLGQDVVSFKKGFYILVGVYHAWRKHSWKRALLQ